MDKALYDDVVRFLRDGSYPSGNNRRRFLVRHRAKRYTFYGRCLRLGSRIVLHEEEAFCALRSLHLRKQHLHGPAFSAAVQKIYVVNRVTVLCFEVVRCCDPCSGTYTHTRESGPSFIIPSDSARGSAGKLESPLSETSVSPMPPSSALQGSAPLRSIWLDPGTVFVPSFRIFCRGHVKTLQPLRSG